MQHPTLMCEIKSLSYDFDEKVGTLVMEDGDCCDMAGCIALFEAIDPAVKGIATISGEQPDTMYVRSASGWVAR
jgi:hypothetical protein